MFVTTADPVAPTLSETEFVTVGDGVAVTDTDRVASGVTLGETLPVLVAVLVQAPVLLPLQVLVALLLPVRVPVPVLVQVPVPLLGPVLVQLRVSLGVPIPEDVGVLDTEAVPLCEGVGVRVKRGLRVWVAVGCPGVALLLQVGVCVNVDTAVRSPLPVLLAECVTVQRCVSEAEAVKEPVAVAVAEDSTGLPVRVGVCEAVPLGVRLDALVSVPVQDAVWERVPLWPGLVVPEGVHPVVVEQDGVGGGVCVCDPDPVTVGEGRGAADAAGLCVQTMDGLGLKVGVVMRVAATDAVRLPLADAIGVA